MIRALLDKCLRPGLGLLLVVLVTFGSLLCLRISNGPDTGDATGAGFRPAAIAAVKTARLSVGDGLQLQVSGQNLERVTRATLVPDFGNRHRVLGDLHLWGKVSGVAVGHGHAFVANMQRGLVIVDLSRGGTPTICGSLQLPGRSWRVTLAGNLALVSALEEGLHIVDVSNPERPQLLATIPTRDYCWQVCWDKGLIYLANGKEGLLVYDLKQPNRPQKVASLDTPGMVVDVLVAGDRIFLADSRHGIRVAEFSGGRLQAHELLPLSYGYWKLAYDSKRQLLFGATGSDGLSVISTPPGGVATLLEQRSELSYCGTVMVHDNRVFAGSSNGIATYGMGDGKGLQPLGEILTRSRACALGAEGQTLVAASIEYGLELLNIEPDAPLFLPRKLSNLRWVSDVDFSVDGDLLTSPGGELVALGTAQNIKVDESVVFKHLQEYSSVWGSADYLVACVGDKQLQLLSARAPVGPVAWFETRGGVTDILFRDDLMLVADRLEGLLLFDLRSHSPLPIGRFSLATGIRSMALAGNLVYLADGLGGLKIVDVGHPRRPVLLGSKQWPGPAVKVAVVDRQAYVAVKGEGLVSVNCRDPRHPVVQDVVPGEGDLAEMRVAGDKLILSHQNRPISIYRLLDGRMPELFQVLETSNGGALMVAGEFLVSTTDQGLGLFHLAGDGRFQWQRLIDETKSFPTTMALAGNDLAILTRGNLILLPWNNGALGEGEKVFSQRRGAVARNGDLAYLIHQNTLELLDLSDLQKPVTISQTRFDGEVKDLLYMDGLLIVAMAADGLQIFDVRDSKRVRLVGHFKVDNMAVSLARYGHLVVVADYQKGVELIDVSRPEQPRLVSRVRYPEPMQTFSQTMAVDVQGDLCYLADGKNGLTVVDLSNPEQPRIVARAETPGNAAGVHVAGGRAYVIDNNIGVHIFDLDLNGFPEPVGTIPFPRSVLACWQRQDRLLLASPLGGLFVLPPPVDSTAIRRRNWGLEIDFTKNLPAGYYTLQLLGGDLMDEVEKTIRIDPGASVPGTGGS